MLQRIQTLWMLLAAVCVALTFNFSFYSGNVAIGANGHEFRRLTAIPRFINGSVGNILILIITIVILAGILINIFNFKARRKQLLITVGLIILSLINLLLYYRASGNPNFVEGTYDLTAVLTLAPPILLILAVRGIMRDQKLVKSADRLR